MLIEGKLYCYIVHTFLIINLSSYFHYLTINQNKYNRAGGKYYEENIDT